MSIPSPVCVPIFFGLSLSNSIQIPHQLNQVCRALICTAVLITSIYLNAVGSFPPRLKTQMSYVTTKEFGN